MKNKDQYLFPGVKAEVERLSVQAKVWQPEVETLLDRINIQPGWRCADLGCGPVGILEPLSRRVGAMGRVVGLDADPHFIHAAESWISQKNIKNIEMIKGDIYKTNLPPQSFDLTHVRFVLTPLGCDHELLEEMIKLTRKGGMVATEESDMTSWNCYPVHPVWEKLKQAIMAVFTQSGGDINAGQRTFQLLRSVGLKDIQIRASVLTMPSEHPYRYGMNQLANALRERILKSGNLKEQEFDKALAECNQVLADPNVMVFSYHLVQVWGRM